MLDPGFLAKIRRRERIAKWVIVSGGVLIVISVLGILFQIASVAVPLFFPPTAERVATIDLDLDAIESVAAFGMDDYFETGFLLERSGRVRFYRVADSEVLSTAFLRSPGDDASESPPPEGEGATIVAVQRHGLGDVSLTWSDGSVSRDRIELAPAFDDGNRFIEHRTRRLVAREPQQGRRPVRASVASLGGGFSILTVDEEGKLELHVRVETTSLFGDSEVSDHRFPIEGSPGRIRHLLLGPQGDEFYGAAEGGWLLRWTIDLSDPESISQPELADRIEVAGEGIREIAAIGYVFGGESIVVGAGDGSLSRWFPVRSPTSGGRFELTRTGTLPAIGSRPVSIHPTQRDKSVLVLGESGVARLDHATSERNLLDFEAERPLRLASLNERADGLAGLDDAGRIHVWRLDNPHPEISAKILFGKPWYEGYDEPSHDWQSSAATQDSEPKLSLVPLIFGTIKGTFYAMMFAVPLAVLGALYTSQFLHPRLRGVIKPMIEIMAAIPSVVIGFLAAIWFAPILQRSMGGLVLAFLVLPVVIFLTVTVWYRLGLDRVFKRVRKGYEFFALVPSVLIAVLVSLWVGRLAEHLLFDGEMQTFLFETFDVVYDPRNCIVIAFALGFAVIPIIFTIAEDSLSNVPRSLAAGSLALGASRWQTAWRVVLPAGLPGIFAAMMIGLGRAIGETMIVLMATGNTAIMDWSPFNGMRTISANIATEAPEAPYLGSLYRVLFLSAVILFLSTFALNTVAEVVRHRIRRKFARF